MKVRIRGEEGNNREPEMNLYLEQHGSDVKLKATNETGQLFTIARISDEGINLVGSLPVDWPVHGKSSVMRVLRSGTLLAPSCD